MGKITPIFPIHALRDSKRKKQTKDDYKRHINPQKPPDGAA